MQSSISDYSFKQLSSLSCKKSKNIILDSFNYHPSRGIREKEILVQTFIDAYLGNTKITLIGDERKDKNNKVGLIALSNGSLELDSKALPAVIIDYIFVDYFNRGKENKADVSIYLYLINRLV